MQLPGANPLGLEADWANSVPFRQSTALLTAIGDPGQIAFVFQVAGCVYTTWLGPGLTMEEAEQYIALY